MKHVMGQVGVILTGLNEKEMICFESEHYLCFHRMSKWKKMLNALFKTPNLEFKKSYIDQT